MYADLPSLRYMIVYLALIYKREACLRQPIIILNNLNSQPHIIMSSKSRALATIALAFTRSALASIAGPVIQNINFPDPSVINFGGVWYAFGTGTTVNIPFAASTDYDTWTLQTTNGVQNDALPNLPAWAVSDDPTTVWAPDVNQVVRLQFSTRDTQCAYTYRRPMAVS